MAASDTQLLPQQMRALLLLLLLQVGNVMSAGEAGGSACFHLFAAEAADKWRRVTSPSEGEIIRQTPGELLDISLDGNPAVKRHGAAAVMLLDGALVAYGGGWEEDDSLVLPSVSTGTHTLTVGVVSDTGGATWKRDTDLCVVQTMTFVIEELPDEQLDHGAAQPSHGAVGAITWPRHGARLLTSEVHLLRFTLRETKDISFECNGQQVREVSPYDAGEHETIMDFLPLREGGGAKAAGAGAAWGASGDITVVLVVWEDESREASQTGIQNWERPQMEQVQVVIRLVEEPPNILIQFPHDGYTFEDESNVNVAALVPYFAFHRFPSVVSGFLRVDVDAQDAMYAQVVRDSEGVFEVTMTFGAPFNSAGRHDMSLVLLDAHRQPLSGHVELHYLVATRKSARVDGVGKDDGENSRMDASVERVRVQVPLGSWAAFAGARGHPPTAKDGLQEALRQSCRSYREEGNQECSGHGKCVNLDELGRAVGSSEAEGTSGLAEAEWGCICNGNWIGSACNTSLDAVQEFLPRELPYLDAERRALSATLLNGSQELLRQLAHTHDTRNCRLGKALAFDYNDQGLAAVVSDASVQLTWAFRQGKAAAFRGLWMYGAHAACQHAPGVRCHFLSHFDCGEEEDLEEADFEAHPRDVIPQGFVGRGSFWWYAHVTHFLLQENSDFRLKLSAAKAALGFQRPIIGVHVRNGDYCSFENDNGGLCLMYRHCICDGFQPYLERIQRMQSLYGISTVFIATQDARILLAAQAQPGLRVIALPFDRDQLTGKAAKKALHWRQKQGYVDSELVSESALLDLFMLAECDVFIGAFHSQYSRLAYQLMAMRQGLHPPFASVHHSWATTLTYPL